MTKRQSAIGNRQSTDPEAVARVADDPEEANRPMVEVAPHRFVNERALKRLREAGL